MGKDLPSKYIKPRWPFLQCDKRGYMVIDGVPIRDIIKKHGTPIYVMVESEIRRRMQMFKHGIPYPKVKIQYASKCNSNLEILRIAKEEGLEQDASSTGEIILGLMAGFKPEQINYTNLYKTEQDVLFAAKIGVNSVSADSVEELRMIAKVCKSIKHHIKIALRINPMIDVGSYTSRKLKYGIPHHYAKRAIDFVKKSPYMQLVGLHFHGGYISNPKIYEEAAKKLLNLAKYCESIGVKLKFIDLGGGFPIKHTNREVFTVQDFGPKFAEFFRKQLEVMGLPMYTLIFEPGKAIVGNAGIGLTTVVSSKRVSRRNFLVVDASTYAFVPDPLICDWYYEILPASDLKRRRSTVYDIGGSTCDAWDIIGTNRWLPTMSAGENLAIMDCGAYSSVLASNFNTLKKASMVMVWKDGTFSLIRRRDRYSEMFAPELDVLREPKPKELKSLYNTYRVDIQKFWGNKKKK
ncbi:MAG: diaminopimelate decarboxylase [archaeon]